MNKNTLSNLLHDDKIRVGITVEYDFYFTLEDADLEFESASHEHTKAFHKILLDCGLTSENIYYTQPLPSIKTVLKNLVEDLRVKVSGETVEDVRNLARGPLSYTNMREIHAHLQKELSSRRVVTWTQTVHVQFATYPEFRQFSKNIAFSDLKNFTMIFLSL